MEDSWEEEKAAFIAGEIGCAVVELIVQGCCNTKHKGVLRDATELVRNGS